jgi:hypothetical protein
MKSLIYSILSIFKNLKPSAYRNTFEREVELIFDKYILSNTFINRYCQADLMSELGQKYPKEWLPNYCASYFYIVIIFSIPNEKSQSKITKETILKESQKNLGLAFNKIKKCPPKIQLDFYALQSLIYDLENRISKDEASNKQFTKKRTIEFKQEQYVQIQNSPLVDEIVGNESIEKGDSNLVYARQTLLKKAKQKYFIDRYNYYNVVNYYNEGN